MTMRHLLTHTSGLAYWITNQFAAEFGRAAGSIVSAVTKSGSDSFRGSAFWFQNEESLNSRTNLDKAAKFAVGVSKFVRVSRVSRTEALMNRRLAGTAILVLALIGCRDNTPTPLTLPTCAYAVSALAVSIGQDGEPGTVAVQTTAGCPWTARSNISWITITAGNSGSGNGSLNYSVQANFETSARTGTLTVADVTVTMTQAAFSSPFSSPFVGRWRNEDPETGSITRVSSRVSGDAFIVHMWGACIPECYWGEAQTSLADEDDGALVLAWNPTFAQKTQELQLLQDGRLRVVTHTRFTDGSGRQPYDSVDYFSRSTE